MVLSNASSTTTIINPEISGTRLLHAIVVIKTFAETSFATNWIRSPGASKLSGQNAAPSFKIASKVMYKSAHCGIRTGIIILSVGIDGLLEKIDASLAVSASDASSKAAYVSFRCVPSDCMKSSAKADSSS